VIDYLVTTF